MVEYAFGVSDMVIPSVKWKKIFYHRRSLNRENTDTLAAID